MSSRFNFWRKASGRGASAEPGGPGDMSLSSTILPSGILKDFLRAITRKEKAVVLDIGSVVGPNVEYFLGLGMKLYMEDLLEAYSKSDYSSRVDDRWTFNEKKFFKENFKYPKDFFDGLICWDSMSYLDPTFAKTFVTRVSAMMKPKSLVLGLFQTKRQSGPRGLNKYRITSQDDLEHIPISREMEIQKIYQTRDVTQLFGGYESQRFYLMKHNILEVLLQKR